MVALYTNRIDMSFTAPPVIENEEIRLTLLVDSDFDALYEVASDEKIWAQHPNKNRWQKPVFRTFFEGALASQCAYKITSLKTGEVMGSTRFYDYDEHKNAIFIGYTFFGTRFWGKGINPIVKALMLNEIFKTVDTVIFQIGAQNIRSRKAIERLGASLLREEEVAYYGEPSRLNAIYSMEKSTWNSLHPIQ